MGRGGQARRKEEEEFLEEEWLEEEFLEEEFLIISTTTASGEIKERVSKGLGFRVQGRASKGGREKMRKRERNG